MWPFSELPHLDASSRRPTCIVLLLSQAFPDAAGWSHWGALVFVSPFSLSAMILNKQYHNHSCYLFPSLDNMLLRETRFYSPIHLKLCILRLVCINVWVYMDGWIDDTEAGPQASWSEGQFTMSQVRWVPYLPKGILGCTVPSPTHEGGLFLIWQR